MSVEIPEPIAPGVPVWCPYDFRQVTHVGQGEEDWLQYRPCGHWEPAVRRAERQAAAAQREREEQRREQHAHTT